MRTFEIRYLNCGGNVRSTTVEVTDYEDGTDAEMKAISEDCGGSDSIDKIIDCTEIFP